MHSRCAKSTIAVQKNRAYGNRDGLQRISREASMFNYGHFIGGKVVAGKSGRTAEVFQPMDGTVRASVALASRSEVRAAVEDAKAAQLGWAATNPQRRARVLMKFLELIARDNNELADILAREHGKTIA